MLFSSKVFDLQGCNIKRFELILLFDTKCQMFVILNIQN